MRCILLSLALILSLAAVGLADTVVIQPDDTQCKDATVYEGEPDQNNGDIEYICVGDDHGMLWSYIEFNDLDSYMGVTVVSATLELYRYGGFGTVGDPSWVDQANGDWAEGTITWNNQPGWRGVIYYFFNAPPIDNWLSIEVTSMVADWLGGGFPHWGFIIGNETGVLGGMYFRSGEYLADPALRPKLTMEYSPVGVQPTSFGEIKAMFK